MRVTTSTTGDVLVATKWAPAREPDIGVDLTGILGDAWRDLL